MFGHANVYQLLSGTAEIFGTEIVPEQTYTFVGAKAAIFTYHGATLSVRGSPKVAYVGGETPMMSYANLHFSLERLRQNSEDTQSMGPRVLLLGAVDAGKSTLAKILTAYAVRQGRSPILVGLDPKQVYYGIVRCAYKIVNTISTWRVDSDVYLKHSGCRRGIWFKCHPRPISDPYKNALSVLLWQSIPYRKPCTVQKVHVTTRPCRDFKNGR